MCIDHAQWVKRNMFLKPIFYKLESINLCSTDSNWPLEVNYVSQFMRYCSVYLQQHLTSCQSVHHRKALHHEQSQRVSRLVYTEECPEAPDPSEWWTSSLASQGSTGWSGGNKNIRFVISKNKSEINRKNTRHFMWNCKDSRVHWKILTIYLNISKDIMYHVSMGYLGHNGRHNANVSGVHYML